MFTTGVAVYFIEHEGVMKNITKGMNRERLIFFSDLAATQLKDGGHTTSTSHPTPSPCLAVLQMGRRLPGSPPGSPPTVCRNRFSLP